MNKDTKKMLKIVGNVNQQVVATQIEDYCSACSTTVWKVKIVNIKEYIEEK